MDSPIGHLKDDLCHRLLHPCSPCMAVSHVKVQGSSDMVEERHHRRLLKRVQKWVWPVGMLQVAMEVGKGCGSLHPHEDLC